MKGKTCEKNENNTQSPIAKYVKNN